MNTVNLFYCLFNLPKLKIIYSSISSKNRDKHAQATFILKDLYNRANKVHKYTISDLYFISDFKFEMSNFRNGISPRMRSRSAAWL